MNDDSMMIDDVCVDFPLRAAKPNGRTSTDESYLLLIFSKIQKQQQDLHVNLSQY